MSDFNYQDLIDLGFIRNDYEDSVVYKETGYHPFYLRKKLAKRIFIDYLSGEIQVSLIRIDDQNNIVGKIQTDEKTQIIQWIKFFGKEVSNG